MRFVAAFVALAALAAGPQTRPARSSDLPGVWLMADMTRNAPFDPEDKQFAPYQIFGFDKRGGMKHMTSAKPFTEGQLALFNSAPQITRYSVDGSRTLMLSNPSWDAPLKYQCRLVTKAEPASDPKSPQAGDLLLAATDDRGREVWSKLLRKAP